MLKNFTRNLSFSVFVALLPPKKMFLSLMQVVMMFTKKGQWILLRSILALYLALLLKKKEFCINMIVVIIVTSQRSKTLVGCSWLFFLHTLIVPRSHRLRLVLLYLISVSMSEQVRFLRLQIKLLLRPCIARASSLLRLVGVPIQIIFSYSKKSNRKSSEFMTIFADIHGSNVLR